MIGDAPTGYTARYETSEYFWELPVVTHSQNGVAMVYNDDGLLVEAPTLPHFRGVVPNKLWIFKRQGK